MDRLAAHVIATAALTVTLATVPVLFADASHAASTPVPAVSSAATATVNSAVNSTVNTAEDSAEDPAAPGAAAPAGPTPQASNTVVSIPELGPGTALAPGAQPPSAATAPVVAPAPLPLPHTAHPTWPRHLRRFWALPFRPVPCVDARQVGATVHLYYRGMIAFSVKQYYSPSCHAYYGYSFAWLQFRKLHVRYDVGMAVYSDTHDAIDGARTFVGGSGGPSFWSAPVPATKGECTQGEGHYFFYPTNAPAGFEESDSLSTRFCH